LVALATRKTKGTLMMRTKNRVPFVVTMVFCVAAFAGCTATETPLEKAREQGKRAFDNNDFDVAIRCYTEVLRLDPEDAQAYWFRGASYTKKGDYDKAIADCTEAIRLDSNNALAYCFRGASYAKKRDYDKAIADSTEAIRLDPNNPLAYRLRGVCYNEKGEKGKADADFAEAKRLGFSDK
jgi:tetratricopeptide (TPR) repeat protein